MNRISFLAPLASLVLAVTIACNATPPLESRSNPEPASLIDQCSLRPCDWNQMGQPLGDNSLGSTPSLAMSASVPVVANLEGSNFFDTNTYVRAWNGTGWGNATKLNDAGSSYSYWGDTRPAIAANATTQIVAFVENVYHEDDMVIRLKTRSSSGAWVAFDPVSDRGLRGFSKTIKSSVRLVLDADSLPIVVWREESSPDSHSFATFARRYQNGAWQNLGALPYGTVCDCDSGALSRNGSETYLSSVDSSALWHLDSSDHFRLVDAPFLSYAQVDNSGAPVETTINKTSGEFQLWRLSSGAWVHLGPPVQFGGQQGLVFTGAYHLIFGNTIWAVGSYDCIPKTSNPTQCEDSTPSKSFKLRFMRYNGSAWTQVGTAFTNDARPWSYSYLAGQWPNGNPIVANVSKIFSWGLTPLSNGVFDTELQINVVSAPANAAKISVPAPTNLPGVGAPANRARITVNGPSLNNVAIQDTRRFGTLTPGTYTITAQSFTTVLDKTVCTLHTPTVLSQTAVVIQGQLSTATVKYLTEPCDGP